VTREHERGEKCLQGFVGNTGSQETATITLRREDSIKIDGKEIVFGACAA
jgi:hypothetical protein